MGKVRINEQSSLTKKIRLNKYLASLGVASRRKVDEMIEQGRIEVNGSPIKTLGFKVDPSKDKVKVDGKLVAEPEKLVYIALNKPIGVVSTALDELGRETVLDLVEVPERVYPVGRLDQESHGLILLTNDGALAQKLTHPKFHIPKTYEVLIQGMVDVWQLNKLKNGVILKDGKTAPADVEILSEKDNRVLLKIVLHEGKNRQIRRMCAAIKLNLLDLKRVAMGPVELANLAEGKWRYLTDQETAQLQAV